MNADSKDLLGIIGHQLDQGIFPLVKNGGLVVPSESTVSSSILGKESHHERKAWQREATKSRTPAIEWERALRESWSAGGSWTSCAISPVFGTGISPFYQEPLSLISEAYPGARIWTEGESFWLYSESSLFPRLGRKASFLTGVSTQKRSVRSWAFWKTNLIGANWIGPRHTNFPDGSICAYEPSDGTWVFGNSLVELLDIYSVWALRHLYYETFGRWPGPQVVHIPYERILELTDDECCSCGSSNLSYGDCCKEFDLKRNRIADAIQFSIISRWSQRKPPTSVVNFMRNVGQPPRISEVI